MRTKFTATLTALMATLALVASPAYADTDTGEEVEDVEVEDADGDGLGQVRSAAARARTAAQDLEDGDADAELEAGQERATEALQAVVHRFSVEGAGGSGVAAEILAALIDGESPSEIGAAHGADMAKAAADRRAERSQDAGRPDHAGPPENTGRPEGAGRP
jgi:hypothetical protein